MKQGYKDCRGPRQHLQQLFNYLTTITGSDIHLREFLGIVISSLVQVKNNQSKTAKLLIYDMKLYLYSVS